MKIHGLVYDNDDSNRGNVMREKLEEAANKYFIKSDSESFKLHKAIPRIIYQHITEETKIVFIHARNDGAKSLMKEMIKRKIGVVVFTGGDEVPKWFEINEYTFFLKRIENIAIDYEKFFKYWANNINAESISIPPFNYLICASFNNTILLLILCQGYLVVNNPEFINEEINIDNTIIINMKKLWMNKYSKNPISWWELICDRNVVDDINKEWGDAICGRDDVDTLIKVIKENDIIDVSIVYNAYIQIKNRLKLYNE